MPQRAIWMWAARHTFERAGYARLGAQALWYTKYHISQFGHRNLPQRAASERVPAWDRKGRGTALPRLHSRRAEERPTNGWSPRDQWEQGVVYRALARAFRAARLPLFQGVYRAEVPAGRENRRSGKTTVHGGGGRLV